MNNLGDTSFNKRNLLKQGLGVNLYPLPFAKGGSLPKAQDGQKLSWRERREARHGHRPEVIRKATNIAKQEMNRPWLERQLMRPQAQITKLASVFDPTGITGWNPLYRDYKNRLSAGDSPGLAAVGAGVTHGLQALPILGGGAWKSIIKNPSNLLKLPTVGIAESGADPFVGGAGSLPAAAFNTVARTGANAVRGLQTTAGAMENITDGNKYDKNELGLFSRERDVPWHLVRQARRDIREQRRIQASGGSMPGYRNGGKLPESNHKFIGGRNGNMFSKKK